MRSVSRNSASCVATNACDTFTYTYAPSDHTSSLCVALYFQQIRHLAASLLDISSELTAALRFGCNCSCNSNNLLDYANHRGQVDDSVNTATHIVFARECMSGLVQRVWCRAAVRFYATTRKGAWMFDASGAEVRLEVGTMLKAANYKYDVELVERGEAPGTVEQLASSAVV
jgi:hypothetical protein